MFNFVSLEYTGILSHYCIPQFMIKLPDTISSTTTVTCDNWCFVAFLVHNYQFFRCLRWEYVSIRVLTINVHIFHLVKRHEYSHCLWKIPDKWARYRMFTAKYVQFPTISRLDYKNCKIKSIVNLNVNTVYQIMICISKLENFKLLLTIISKYFTSISSICKSNFKILSTYLQFYRFDSN